MRALQKKICQYNAADNEQIHQVLYLAPGHYLFLLNCAGEWVLREFAEGVERARLVMKNIVSHGSSSFTDDKPLLFDPGNGGFAILVGTDILFWNSIGDTPRKSFIKTGKHDKLSFEYPVQSLRMMPDGALLLLRRHVFSHSQYYSIAVERLEGYTIGGVPRALNPEDYRASAYIATKPCICDIMPYGEDLLIHTPGSIRNWSRFDAEASLLIRQNRKGQIVSCTVVEKGWGTFTADGKSLVINPFGDEKTFFYYDLESLNSSFYITDDTIRWTPATRDTRYIYAGSQIMAWNLETAMLTEHYNAPSSVDDHGHEGSQAG